MHNLERLNAADVLKANIVILIVGANRIRQKWFQSLLLTHYLNLDHHKIQFDLS